MRFSSMLRGTIACLAGGLAIAYAPAASGVAISNISVSLNGSNSPDSIDDAGAVVSQLESSVGVVSSAAMQFLTRYAAGVYTDTGGLGAADNSITLNASYTVSFDVTDAGGSLWQLDIDTSRVGARTAVSDENGNGQSAWALSGVTGTNSGAGTLSSGSLDLGAIANSQQSGAANIAFGQTGNALINGMGNGTVTLTFNFTATAQTIVQGNGANARGDEAAIRMGTPSTLSSFTAGSYPGPDARDPAADGHFIDVLLADLGPIPEPGTAALLGLGLVLLGGWRRSERRQDDLRD